VSGQDYHQLRSIIDQVGGKKELTVALTSKSRSASQCKAIGPSAKSERDALKKMGIEVLEASPYQAVKANNVHKKVSCRKPSSIGLPPQ
jgi:hypothetical protein